MPWEILHFVFLSFGSCEMLGLDSWHHENLGEGIRMSLKYVCKERSTR